MVVELGVVVTIPNLFFQKINASYSAIIIFFLNAAVIEIDKLPLESEQFNSYKQQL